MDALREYVPEVVLESHFTSLVPDMVTVGYYQRHATPLVISLPDPREGFEGTEVAPWERDEDPAEALTELGMARRLVAAMDGRYRWAPEIRTWLYYNEIRWEEDLTGEIDRLTKGVIDELHSEARFADYENRKKLSQAWSRFQSAPRIRNIIELARTEPGVPVRMEEVDADPWGLNCANGVVNLRTGRLRPHDPAEMHSKVVPVDYDPDNKAPVFLRFLEEVFSGDRDLIRFVQRFAGYSLCGIVRERCSCSVTAPAATARRPCSTRCAPWPVTTGCSSTPPSSWPVSTRTAPDRPTDLRGARLVTTIETDEGKRLAEALIKQLTGNDRIRARRMRCDYFEFTPSHTIWLAGNHLPSIRGTDHGIWRRIALRALRRGFRRRAGGLGPGREARGRGSGDLGLGCPGMPRLA